MSLPRNMNRFLLPFFLAILSLPALSANRLAQSDSPYLRMHAENPVDWFPWGDEAFETAKREGKPVFLSIGYSSCYWCRVAEETLYRDPAIAARMNAGFVNIKVDREQRPDLDRLYMAATRQLGAGGGWPNNLFLTPERKPFFAGSYFPPADDDFGRTGFPTILARIDEAWANRRGDLLARAETVVEALRHQALPIPAVAEPDRWRRESLIALLARIDTEYGGLKSGGPAKFPQVPELMLLTGDKPGAAAVRRALDAMARSALRDHLGGGFHRYTVDPRWNQPHFEKMLYDNAQLLRLYVTAGRGRLHREAAMQTADFLLREMQAPEGGFHASIDAVAEGREGAHYLWDEEEIRAVLGPAAVGFLAVYDIVPLPGHPDDAGEDFGRERGPLRLRESAAGVETLAAARAKLLRHRAARPAPARDDKIILAWNGLAIEAQAVAGSKLHAPWLTEAADKAAERLWREAWEPAAGRLRHALFEGRAQGEGFLEDYALFGLGLLALDEATGKREWRLRAVVLAEAMLARFTRAGGGLAETVHAAELFAPSPESGDGAYPAGASAAYRLLARLATFEPNFGASADKLLASLAPHVARAPERWPALLASPVAAPSGSAAEIAGTAGVVSVKSRWRAAEGGERLVVTVRIASGWHVNAHPAGLDTLISTRLVFEGAQPRTVHYPKAERFRAAFAGGDIPVYAGTIAIAADFAGRRPSSARLTVQACSEEVCLPPVELRIKPR